MVDQADSAQPLDSLGERLNGDVISRLRDRHTTDDLLAEMVEVERGIQNARNDRRIGGDSLRDEIGGALCVPHFVRGDSGQQVGEDLVFRLLAEAAEEVVRQVLGEHEFHQARDDVRG